MDDGRCSIARHRDPQDRGLTLVLVALSMVVMLIFVAFAVDIGLLYNERRQDQSAADASATSGGVVAINSGNLQAVVDEVLAKVTADVDRPVTNAQWVNCVDPDNLALTSSGHTAQSLGLTPATPCVSWSEAFDEMRVRLPDQTVQTYFASVIGINTLDVSAFAHIEFVPVLGSGGALPFVALATATAGQHICIRTSSAGDPPAEMIGNGVGVVASPGVSPVNADPCDSGVYDPASSTFGTLTPADYLGGCDTQNENVMQAIMNGTDHATGYFGDPTDNNPPPFSIPVGGTSSAAEASRTSAYGDVRIDGPTTGPASSRCTTFTPNTLAMNTGLSNSNLRCALISPHNGTARQCNGLTPRLQQISSFPSSNLFVGESFDNNPPWSYISSSSNLPLDCREVRDAQAADNANWDQYDRAEAFLSCVTLWTAGSLVFDDLFTEAIGLNPRFVYVPQVAERRLCNQQEPPGCNSLDDAHINSYVPIFLYRMYSNQGSHTPCDPLDTRGHTWAIHQPGQSFADCGGDNSAVDRLSAIVLDCRSLPSSVCDEARLPGVPGNPGSVTTLVDIELSR